MLCGSLGHDTSSPVTCPYDPAEPEVLEVSMVGKDEYGVCGKPQQDNVKIGS